MALTFLLYAWPLWFVLIASFSDPNLVQAGQVLLLPKGFHLGGYKLILEYQDILRGYLNSILYTVVGTALNLVMTICAAYPLSGKIDMASSGMEMEAVIQKLKTAQTLKYSVIVVSTVPLMLVYPFIQKYFVKGIMLGAVKG